MPARDKRAGGAPPPGGGRVSAAAAAADPAPGTADWWRPRYQQRTRSRGRSLDVDRICRAALAVLDTEGIEALTMRRVADQLGTGAASLYRHVAGRQDLLVEVVDRVLGDVEAPPEALGWRGAVEELAHSLRAALLSHRGVVLAMAPGPLLGPNAMRLRELFWRVMRRDGCDAAFAVQTYFCVVHLVVSSALFTAGAVHRHRTRWDGTRPSGLDELTDVLPADRYPTVVAFAAHGARPDPEHDFSVGLRALLDGLEASRA